MEKLSILAPAKVNLYLNVGARRADGYHDIESVMQTVTLFDRIVAVKKEPAGKSVIHLFCKDPRVPTDKTNLIWRAAEAFFAEAGISEFDVSLTLEKNIPVEAGLGGGSSDAAATLLVLEHLYETTIPHERMYEIAATLGADIPFCIKKGTVYATGIGEKMESAPPMPDSAFLVAIPKGSRIRTADAYRALDAAPTDETAVSFADFKAALSSCKKELIAARLYNRFEDVTPSETGSAALCKKLISLGALGARMSGSGPSVFALFPDFASARKAKEALPDTVSAFVCVPARRDYPYIEH